MKQQPNLPVCGANKKSGGLCQNVAGKKTPHLHSGRCWLHGGLTPIKSGAYSQVTRAELQERVKKYKEDPELLNLEYDVAMLRAITEYLINEWDEIFGPEGALVAWHKSFKKGEDKGKPAYLPDVNLIAKFINTIGVTVDRINRHKGDYSVSLGTINRVMGQLGAEVAAAVQAAVSDAALRTAICEGVERRWKTLKLDAYTEDRS